MIDFSEFAEKIGVDFKDENLLKQALTHRSYLNENPEWPLEHNERLEFLGDAVLELAASEFLYERFPEKPEGELTTLRAALVNTQSLSETAAKLEIGDYIFLSKGEAKEGGRSRITILSNTYEAVIGAVYLDQGYKKAKEFIMRTLIPKIDDIISKGLFRDAKSFFQEKAQEIAGITPAYKVLEEWGPDHDKHFLIGVYIGEEMVAQGEGPSKQAAETEAARRALEIKRWK
jgi:ribonuclease-3